MKAASSSDSNLPKRVLADLAQGKAKALYFLYGEEPFKIQEFAKKFQDAFLGEGADVSFSIDRMDGSQCSVEDVLDAVATTGFLFGGGANTSKRLVFVRQAHALKNGDKLMEWCKEQPTTDVSNILLLIADSIDGRKKFHQWLKNNGQALEFRKAADQELAQWAAFLAKKRGVVLEREAADALAVLCDGSLYRLDQEIEKAWLYKGGAAEGTRLSGEDIAMVASHDVSHQMADLVNAVFEGKRARALLSTGRVIQSSEDALGFVGFCVWALKNPERFRSVSTLMRKGKERSFLGELAALDRKLKGSGLEAQSLVNEFVVKVC